jgi:hypothetical protein
MSKTTALVLAAILAMAACAIGVLSGVITLSFGTQSDKTSFGNKGMLEVICDVEISRPGDTLTPPFDSVKLTLPAIFNFEENTAAYPGEYTISMNRKGTLQVKEALLEMQTRVDTSSVRELKEAIAALGGNPADAAHCIEKEDLRKYVHELLLVRLSMLEEPNGGVA